MNRQERNALLWVVGGGFLAVCMALVFVAVPAGNKDLLLILVGALGGAFSALAGVKPPERKDEPKQ